MPFLGFSRWSRFRRSSATAVSAVSFLLLTLSGAGSVPAFAATPEKTEVVIVGAGLSGLAAAYELKKSGVPYHILELTPRVGGRVRTVRYHFPRESPVYADSGMEEYWESNPAVKLLQELKLPVRSDVAVSSIVINDKLEALGDEDPQEFQQRIFSEAEFEALLQFKAKIAPLIRQLEHDRPLPDELLELQEISLADWVKQHKLPQRVREWLRISLECEIGTTWGRISAIDGLAELHLFADDGEMCYRVLGGNVKFTDALAQEVGLANVSLNKRVNRVVTRGDRVFVYFLDMADNTSGVVEASHVISTIPLFRLFEVQFEPPLSAQKVQAINSMTWGAYFKAHVFVPPAAERFWIQNGNSVLPILSDSNLGVIYDGNPDQAGQTRIISLLVTGDHADRFNLMNLDAVRGELQAAFEKLWPGFTQEIRGMDFYRFHPRAIAAWPVGRSRFDEGSEAVRQPEHRVYLAGDFTESSHSDGAFLSAQRSVEQILKAGVARRPVAVAEPASTTPKRPGPPPSATTPTPVTSPTPDTPTTVTAPAPAPAESSGPKRGASILVWMAPTIMALFFWGIGQGFVKKYISEVPPARFCLYFVVAKALVNLWYFSTNEHPAPLAEDGREFLIAGVLAYLLDGAAWILYFQSIAAGPITIVGTLSAAYPALTVLFAKLFLNETLQDLQYAGVAMVIVGCVGLSYSPFDPAGKPANRRWIPLAASALILWGVAQTIVKHSYSLPGASDANLALFNTIGGGLTLGVFGLAKGLPGQHSGGEWLRSFLPMGMLAAGDLCVIVATQMGPVSVVTPVSGAYPLVTLAFAWLVLRERITNLHLACIVLILIGIVLSPGLGI